MRVYQEGERVATTHPDYPEHHGKTGKVHSVQVIYGLVYTVCWDDGFFDSLPAFALQRVREREEGSPNDD